MKSLLPLLSAVAALALAACNSQPKAPEVVDNNPDPLATALANAPKVELPPAIKAEKSMRCKDSSVVYVTFFEGNKLAFVRTEKNGTPNRLTATETGEPLTAEGGWKMTGTPATIELTRPGKDMVSCKS